MTKKRWAEMPISFCTQFTVPMRWEFPLTYDMVNKAVKELNTMLNDIENCVDYYKAKNMLSRCIRGPFLTWVLYLNKEFSKYTCLDRFYYFIENYMSEARLDIMFYNNLDLLAILYYVTILINEYKVKRDNSFVYALSDLCIAYRNMLDSDMGGYIEIHYPDNDIIDDIIDVVSEDYIYNVVVDDKVSEYVENKLHKIGIDPMLVEYTYERNILYEDYFEEIKAFLKSVLHSAWYRNSRSINKEDGYYILERILGEDTLWSLLQRLYAVTLDALCEYVSDQLNYHNFDYSNFNIDVLESILQNINITEEVY